jgi:uncharacterized repeat protein (TIGR01451 family)
VLDAQGQSRVIYVGSGTTPTIEGLTVVNGSADKGAGIYVGDASAPTLRRLAIISNVASSSGGGIYNDAGNPLLQQVTLAHNTAITGGGMYNHSGNPFIENSIFYDNRASQNGGGIHNAGGALPGMVVRYTTITSNTAPTGGGIGINTGYVLVTGTVVVSNTAATGGGLYSPELGQMTVDYNNVWGNAGGNYHNVITGSHDMHSPPRFVDFAGGDFHLLVDSPCIDAGEPSSDLNVDIDDDPRPQGVGHDLGADETGLMVTKRANPNPVQASALLSYTIHVTNTGNVTLTAAATDTLPMHVIPIGVLTWTPVLIGPHQFWTEQFVVTVEMGYVGPLTNVVRVTTKEGARGETSVTVSAICHRVYLPLVLRNS